jgi:hypothetical protein
MQVLKVSQTNSNLQHKVGNSGLVVKTQTVRRDFVPLNTKKNVNYAP